MFIDKLFQKYGNDPEKMIELAQAEGISPDAILSRSLTRLTNPSERDIFDRQKVQWQSETLRQAAAIRHMDAF